MKQGLITLLALSCCSCATIKTLDPPNNNVTVRYAGAKSYCDEIPRVYSGIAYNVCLLYGEPNHFIMGDPERNLSFLLFDSALSITADTVVLPYTLVTQQRMGNIKVN